MLPHYPLPLHRGSSKGIQSRLYWNWWASARQRQYFFHLPTLLHLRSHEGSEARYPAASSPFCSGLISPSCGRCRWVEFLCLCGRTPLRLFPSRRSRGKAIRRITTRRVGAISHGKNRWDGLFFRLGKHHQ